MESNIDLIKLNIKKIENDLFILEKEYNEKINNFKSNTILDIIFDDYKLNKKELNTKLNKLNEDLKLLLN